MEIRLDPAHETFRAEIRRFIDVNLPADIRARVEEGKRDYVTLAERLGLKALPSATNFVAIDMGDGDRARRTLARLLDDESVFLRMPGVAPLDRLIRVTVGTEPERQGFAEALTRVLARN